MQDDFVDLLGYAEQSGSSTAVVTLTPGTNQKTYITGIMAAYSEPRQGILATTEFTGTGTALAKLAPIAGSRIFLTRVSGGVNIRTAANTLALSSRMILYDGSSAKATFSNSGTRDVTFDPPIPMSLGAGGAGSGTASLAVEASASAAFATAEISGFYEADASALRIKDGSTVVGVWEVNEPQNLQFKPPLRFASGNAIAIGLDPRGTSEQQRIVVYGFFK